MTTSADQFLSKLEAFANTLDTNEQAILAHLLSAEDEVSGFSFSAGDRAAGVVSGPIPIPYANLRPKIDAFVVPGGGAVISGDASKGEI